MSAKQWCAPVQGTVKAKLPPGIDMNVNVLTSGYWPSYPHLEAKLPDELTRYQTVFKVSRCCAAVLCRAEVCGAVLSCAVLLCYCAVLCLPMPLSQPFRPALLFAMAQKCCNGTKAQAAVLAM